MAHRGSLEKVVEIGQLEKVPSGSSDVNRAAINEFTPEEQKKIIRKVDLRLIPTLGFMYCVSLMDRTNMGIAAIAGMNNDLKMVGDSYSIVVCIFFITYVALQPPATVVLRKLGPRLFLPLIVVLWGLAMIAFGFVKKWIELVSFTSCARQTCTNTPIRSHSDFFSVSLRPASSQVAPTSCPAGISGSSFRSETPSSSSSA